MWESINRTLINGIGLAFVLTFSAVLPLFIMKEIVEIRVQQQKSYERLVNN